MYYVAFCDTRQKTYVSADGVPPNVKSRRIHYIIIRGVRSGPPPAGERWVADDLDAGLKLVALLRTRDALVVEKRGLARQDRADLCASFQAAVADVLTEKARRALAATRPAGLSGFAVAGGVAANGTIRAGLESVSGQAGVPFLAPPLALCTDNAAMIAWAGIERFGLGLVDDLGLEARPRWPLDTSQPALIGSGKRGAKA